MGDMPMRFSVLAAASFAVLLAVSPAAAATKISDPVQFVKSVYALIKANKPAPDDIYTPRLQKLFELDRKEAGGEVGRIDFDIFMNAQDSAITDLTVRGVPVLQGPGREVVIAKFKNMGHAQEVHFYFEKVGGNWLIDDARGLTGPDTWTLSLILKYGWDGK
jgi:hypothetical protein